MPTAVRRAFHAQRGSHEAGDHLDRWDHRVVRVRERESLSLARLENDRVVEQSDVADEGTAVTSEVRPNDVSLLEPARIVAEEPVKIIVTRAERGRVGCVLDAEGVNPKRPRWQDLSLGHPFATEGAAISPVRTTRSMPSGSRGS